MEKFWMFPINETGPEKEVSGTRIEFEKFPFKFGLFYIVVNDVRLLIDSVTGMAVWGEFNDTNLANINGYIQNILLNKETVNQINETHNNAIKNGIILTHCIIPIEYSFSKQNIIIKKTSKTVEHEIHSIMNTCNLLDYFSNFLYNKDFGNQTIALNCVVSNARSYVIPYGRKTIDIDVTKEIALSEIPGIGATQFHFINKGFTDIVYKFYFKNTVYSLAYYFPETNSLLLGDIFFSDDTWLKKLVEIIVKTCNLKPIVTNHSKDYEVTIGCDPEFELFDRNNKLMMGNDLNAEGRLQKKIGADGSGRQLELRPTPSTDPAEVVEDLSKLFGCLSQIRISATGDHQPLGGHIHFGCLSKKFPISFKYTQTIIDLLDFFIGKHTVKMSGKARGDYGRLGDSRSQPWGFEYRVPPAGIFATKRMAYITLKLCKNLVETIASKDITASHPITVEQLLPYLTKDEAEYYLNFPEIYKTLEHSNIVQYWTHEQGKKLQLIFYDYWNKSVKEKYIYSLQDMLIDADTTLCLYGIKGEIPAGFHWGDGRMIPHPRAIHCSEGIAIGIPRRDRTEGTNINFICNEIKRKIGTINGTILNRTTEVLFPGELIGSQTKSNCDLEDGEI